MMEKIRVFEAFAGYGSQAMALNRANIPYEVVGISEIDKFAIKAYNAVHGNVINYGDIKVVDWSKIPDFELLTWSSPCQDISSAGNGKGMTEGSGTRSSLLWEVKKAIEVKKPKYILFENVRNFIGKKHKKDADKFFLMLNEYGYSVFYEIMNAKHYGVPQNRERIFIVAIYGNVWYTFPNKIFLKKKLKDIIEEKVDNKYYLKQEVIKKLKLDNIFNEPIDRIKSIEPFIKQYPRGFNPGWEYKICPTITTSSCPNNNFLVEPQVLTTKRTEYGKAIRKDYEAGKIKESRHNMTELKPREDGISNTITTVQKDNLLLERTIRIPQATKQGYAEIKPGSVFDASYPESKTRRGRVQEKGSICPTLTAQGEPPCYYDMAFRIRRLTPRECFRLQGVSDADIDKIQAARISNCQQYKMAGNSIVVDVLVAIFKNLFVKTDNPTLFDKIGI